MKPLLPLLFVLLLSAFTLSAMLGQLDNILAGWYANPANTWCMPFPPTGPGWCPSALVAWEFIYGAIALSYAVAVFCAFLLARSLYNVPPPVRVQT